ncbi:MAG TPA: Mur ligase family protein [Candidatus Dormibacteraeota bacterium]|nr:Mur ligase family protein [Candidatus Dormibacteraeota bacterium]HVD02636.1 Mur ligase family protein [Candidatus Dormibacteraeota bacterium]
METGRSGLPPLGAHLHLLGICGYAVSGLALACRQMGYRVTGSDEDAYPPTTEILKEAGIEFARVHTPANLDRWGVPDLVILGNQVQASNSELEGAITRALPLLSEAEAQGLLARGRLRAVICGTHGKTTTSSLAAWMLEGAGLDPGFRLGSTSRDFGMAVRLGDLSSPFVFEGDEYTTSALDRRAKFLHWHPQVVTLLNLELDHPDLYPNIAAYTEPYRKLVGEIPEDGLLVVNAEAPAALALSASAACRVETFGLHAGDWRLAGEPQMDAGRRQLRVAGPNGLQVAMPLPIFGDHNASNALAALATAVALGASADRSAQAAASYRGAARRFEFLGAVEEVTVVDDYAHHPTKIRATLAGARQWAGPQRQLVIVHVPHTYSRTLALLEDYRDAFEGADLVVLGPIEPARERALAGSVSSADVAARVRGAEVVLVGSAEEAVEVVRRHLSPPALVVCTSVRGFDGVAARLLSALREAADQLPKPRLEAASSRD